MSVWMTSLSSAAGAVSGFSAQVAAASVAADERFQRCLLEFVLVCYGVTASVGFRRNLFGWHTGWFVRITQI